MKKNAKKEKELSLEEAVNLALKVNNWDLIEKQENVPIVDYMDGPYTVGYESIIKYQGILKNMAFDLTWKKGDRSCHEYSLTIEIDGADIAKHEELCWTDEKPIIKLKKLFDYVQKKIVSDKENLRLKRLVKARSYLTN